MTTLTTNADRLRKHRARVANAGRGIAGYVDILPCDEWPAARLDRVAVSYLLAMGWLPEGLKIENHGQVARVVGAEFSPQKLEAIG